MLRGHRTISASKECEDMVSGKATLAGGHVLTPQMKASESEAKITGGGHMSKGLSERRYFWGRVTRKAKERRLMILPQ